ncbi:type II toxin-antitoxin system RelE/ParE family toxin [Longimicrobium sp.]|uniref:type II toxin-antitoxin system RelE/ParE family toxin n=1 Tax=Longimicrobium sp. TaxID=2029185 RepID=UPI002E366AFC|nr:type II toxin-antitoxin system RelE/ParE family toxin [Longimicrobium sp.]HEX6042593.1 type II toxin-antitoxin system RelE/ParE family toxin [Longimicrobium sp.]
MKQPMPPRKKLIGVGSSLRDLHEMPKQVRAAFGNALWMVQLGAHPADSRRFGEGLPREVLKLAENHDGDTYRAAFVADFPECVYLLHVFKKKSTSGIATPKPAIETIRARFAAAREHHRLHFASKNEQ